MFQLDTYFEVIHSSLVQPFGDMQKKKIKLYQKQIKGKGGRKPKLILHYERSIIRSLHYARKQDGNFTSKRINLYSGISSVHDRNVRRVFNKYGYHYRQARGKGMLKQ